MRAAPLVVALALGLAAPVPGAHAETPEYPTGARGHALTVVQGQTVEQIPLHYIGRFDDFAGPGYDIHLVQLEGPLAEHLGVAGGMSGSPVYIDGRLIGALAYRLGAFPKDPIAGVTPIEDILDARRAGGASPVGDPSARRIATPVVASGLTSEVRNWVAPRLEELGFVLTPGAVGATQGDEDGMPFEPGSPIGVALVRGDITFAATGTVTLVDDGTVYAFGHPFFGTGEVEMPMHSARVVHVLADLLGSNKISLLGGEAGAIVEDRLTAIVGRTEGKASMIPVALGVRGASYGEQRFAFEIVRNSFLSPTMAGAVVANALLGNTGFGQEATMFVRGTIGLAGHDDLTVEAAVSGNGAGGHGLAIAGWLAQLMQGLWHNPWSEVVVQSIDLDVAVEPGVHSYEVESLVYDRGPVVPGQQLNVTAVLRPRRGETIRRDLTVTVPQDATRASRLMLAVGTPTEIERALGRPIQARIETAPDIDAVLEALGEQRSSHRLTAVLYERTSGMVTAGQALSGLPPSARHLLSRRRAATENLLVAPLDRREVELDGPVSGGLAVRLTVRPVGGDR